MFSGPGRFLLGLAVAVGLSARAAAAQTTGTLDAGGTRVEYDGGGRTGALTLTPTLLVDRPSWSFGLHGTLSRFSSGSWSTQAALSGSLFAGPFRGVTAEFGTDLEASAQRGAAGTGAGQGGVRLHLLGRDKGAWLGAAAGGASDGEASHSTLAGDLGAWARLRALTVVARVAPSAIGDGLRYTDAHAVGRLERGRLELLTVLGLRDWARPAGIPTTMWGSVSGTVWLNDHVALSAGGGSYPADFAQGFPGGNYLTAAVRLATRRPTARQSVSETAAHPLPPVARPVVKQFSARRGADGRWTLEVRAPGAERLELMATFTEWRVVALESRGGGRWTITLPLAPGTHRMNLRADGGAWGVPPGLPVLTDDFSGVVALLIVR